MLFIHACADIAGRHAVNQKLSNGPYEVGGANRHQRNKHVLKAAYSGSVEPLTCQVRVQPCPHSLIQGTFHADMVGVLNDQAANWMVLAVVADTTREWLRIRSPFVGVCVQSRNPQPEGRECSQFP